jgi:hypothetical protein
MVQEGQNQKNIAEYNAKVQDNNATLAKAASDDAIQRGAQDSAQIRENVKRINARARANLGSTGFLADTGSNLDLLVQNAGTGEYNALTAMNDAERESYGYRIDEANARAGAQNQRLQGQAALDNARYGARLTRRKGLLSAAGTLVTGSSNYYADFGNPFKSGGRTQPYLNSQWNKFLARN